MALILGSNIATHIKNDAGERFPVAFDDINMILTNIKKHLLKTDSIVMVANNPDTYEITDMYAELFFESFKKTGIEFKSKIVLDSRNKEDAYKIINNADLIYLSGGKILCQLKFFEDINLKELLKGHKGLIIGLSAGAMNLCQDVCNFPEQIDELDDPRWAKGLGFCNEIIIPHIEFDEINKKYIITCADVDAMNDYVLRLSDRKKFLGLPDDSYILIDGDNQQIFGEYYIIKDGKVEKRRD